MRKAAFRRLFFPRINPEATVADRIDTGGQVAIGYIGPLRGGVDDGGDAVVATYADHFRRRDLPPVPGVAKKEEHRRALANRRFEFRRSPHIDDVNPHHAHGVVVDVAMTGLHQHLVLHPRGVGESRHPLWIGSGHTSRRQLTESGRTAIDDQTPLALHDLGNALAHRLRQLVEMDVPPGSSSHGLAHFGQYHRAADDGKRPSAVNQWTHVDRLVGGKSHFLTH